MKSGKLEASITDSVRKILKKTRAENPGFFFMKLSDRFTSGIPDYYILYGGQCVWVELKRPGDKPRALQRHILGRLRKAGAVAFTVDNVQAFQDKINEILTNATR